MNRVVHDGLVAMLDKAVACGFGGDDGQAVRHHISINYAEAFEEFTRLEAPPRPCGNNEEEIKLYYTRAVYHCTLKANKTLAKHIDRIQIEGDTLERLRKGGAL